LNAALDSGALKTVKGLGEKKLKTIREGIDAMKSASPTGGGGAARRFGIPEALLFAESLWKIFARCKGVVRAEIAGSLRRRRETIGDVDIVAAAKSEDAIAISKAFVDLPGVIQTIVAGQSKTSSRSPTACRSICGSCRKKTSAQPCNISPAPKSTT
jgi:DNA polymerase (family 10)